MTWRDLAACKDSPTPEIFFPLPGQPVKAAIEVCNSCCVRAACGEYAMENGEVAGVWGGMSIEDLKKARRNRTRRERRERLRAPNYELAPRIASDKVKKHGTRGGYVGGCRCVDCTAADRVYQRDRVRERAATAAE